MSKSPSVRMDATDHALSVTSTITTLLKEVSNLIPNAGPLANVLGVTKELITIINQMRDNNEQCSFLVERILGFLRILSKETERLNELIRDGSPTADRLNELVSRIQEIRQDAEAWRITSRMGRFWSRDKIKEAINKHDKNLTDCFNSFLIGTSYQLGVAADNKAAERRSGVRSGSNPVVPTEENPCAVFAVPDAGYNRSGLRHECLQGTREDVISEIMNWTEGTDSHRICWLSGPAGFGKSAIMQTVAERLEGKGNLAASFFFLRGAGVRSNFKRFITTIAYHISLSTPTSQPFIQRALRKDPTIPSQSMVDQLRKLVTDPLRRIPLGKKPLVVVVDALDECDDRESIRQFISLLARTCGDHPLRFLLASRAEDHIRQAFASGAAQSATYFLELEKFDAGGDITVFLRSKFDEIRGQSPRLFQDMHREWPPFEQLTALAAKSEGLFIFAATVVYFVTDGKGSPQEKLNQVLDSHLGLDPLYAQVLSNANSDDVFNKVLSTIVYLRRQLSITAIALLLDLSPEAVVDRLTEIQSIIRIPANNLGSIQVNHASFRDFLLDERRSKTYYLPSSYETFIVVRSMTIMAKVLKRDEWPSCDAEKYACREWRFHLDGAIRGCASRDLAGEMLRNLQMFTRCDALEVWINTVIRYDDVDVTMGLLRDTKPLLQSKSVLLPDEMAQTIHEIKHRLKVHFHIEPPFDFRLRVP